MAWPAWTENNAPPLDAYMKINVWVCTYCRKTTLVRVVYPESEEQFRDEREVQIIWPELAPRELPEQVPDPMRSLYREASKAENAGALRGAAALYRAAVEEFVRDLGAEGRNLEERIDALAEKGVDDDIVNDLHEARLTGNWSLHEGIEFAADEIADVAQLISDAAEIVYVEPARREAMRQSRAERRRRRSEGERD